jgi:hypothetical protein
VLYDKFNFAIQLKSMANRDEKAPLVFSFGPIAAADARVLAKEQY